MIGSARNTIAVPSGWTSGARSAHESASSSASAWNTLTSRRYRRAVPDPSANAAWGPVSACQTTLSSTCPASRHGGAASDAVRPRRARPRSPTTPTSPPCRSAGTPVRWCAGGRTRPAAGRLVNTPRACRRGCARPVARGRSAGPLRSRAPCRCCAASRLVGDDLLDHVAPLVQAAQQPVGRPAHRRRRDAGVDERLGPTPSGWLVLVATNVPRRLVAGHRRARRRGSGRGRHRRGPGVGAGDRAAARWRST